MGTRLQLQATLEAILEKQTDVYFQAPSNVLMSYPAIIYALDDIDIGHADNAPYRKTRRYLITVIDRDPDSLIPGKVSDLPMTRFSRFYVVDKLNHTVFTTYF